MDCCTVHYCNHSCPTHYFEHPCCDELNLIEKIAIFAFHIFTVGIPLLLYKLYQAITFEAVDLTFHGTITHSEIGKQAMEFAQEILEKHADGERFFWNAGYAGSNSNQPVNKQIAVLATVYWNLMDDLQKVMQDHQPDPWNHKEVIYAADALMKIAYAISCLTLEDLPAFVEKLEKDKNQKRTYALALTAQDSYQYRSFYFATNVYHWLRQGILCEDGKLKYRTSEIPEDIVQPFYEEGTIQHEWNTLYNDYCRTIRLVVPEKDLRDADNRHANWTKVDTKPDQFHYCPDTQPT